MDSFEVAATAAYIRHHGFSRVALQFPDDLLTESVAISGELERACGSSARFFVMADTTFGSCCVDEVAAAHVNADCVVHYGRACLSPVTRLPVRFVFGKSPMQVERCAEALANLAASSNLKLLVLYDLEYAYAIPKLQEAVLQKPHCLKLITYAEIVGREMKPCSEPGAVLENQHEIGGLKWEVPTMDDCKIFWVGKEGPALTSVMLTYNSSSTQTVRCDPETGALSEMTNQSGALWRRYYLIERAKDANIVGIVVGTLGVAGYNQAIQRVKKMVKDAGKKSYTLAVGKPNPAKLANFAECDVFVLVACPQTALVDSKEFFAPVITTFEAELAFLRGSQWTGSYCLDFRKLPIQNSDQTYPPTDEPRFSFVQSSYVSSSSDLQPEIEETEGTDTGDMIVKKSSSSSTALSLMDKSVQPKTASEFFQLRNFQGLQLDSTTEDAEDYRAVIGRKGRAAVYEHEQAV